MGVALRGRARYACEKYASTPQATSASRLSSTYVVQSAGAAVSGIRASIKRIAVGKANIAGVILTKMGSGSSGYGYGYGDGYGYGYGRRYGEEGEEAKG